MLTSVALIGAPLNAANHPEHTGQREHLWRRPRHTSRARRRRSWDTAAHGDLLGWIFFRAYFFKRSGNGHLECRQRRQFERWGWFWRRFHRSSANAFNGISGISGPFAGWLVGVFETDTEPTDPPPASLDFNTIDINFTMLSPAINQLFFIGDALSGHGSGSVQQFAVPVNATRLFLGISDAPGYHGAAGAYDDNAGSFVATFNIPEPTVPALLMFALAAMLVQWPRRLR
jgi:hypothetical protein